MDNTVPETTNASRTLLDLEGFEACVLSHAKVLRTGIELQRQLNQQIVRHHPALKKLVASGLNLKLFVDDVLDRDIPPLVVDAARWAANNYMDITNSGNHRVSVFEPPGAKWRPFVVNFESEKPNSGSLARIQSMMFSRVFKKNDGVFIFPAIGLDMAYLREGSVLSIAPHKQSPAPGSLRMIHLEAKIQNVPVTTVNSEVKRLERFPDAERVLICKGLQSLLSPAEIVRLVKDFEISKIVVLSTACCGLAGHPIAIPHDSAQLSGLLNELYEDTTECYFSKDELKALATVHSLMHENYAWKSGHFPASKVEVFTAY